MKLLDTNVFIYALGSAHPYKDPCNRLLMQIDSQDILANVDIEVLQEVLNIYQYRGDTSRGQVVATQITTAFPKPISVGLPEIHLAAQILVQHPLVESRDAIHAAVVFENRLEGIISTDRGLDVIGGLVRFDPKELAA